MSFDNSFTAVTGATYQASEYNTYTKGNFTAIWVGTTAGDMEYYTSATAKARLAKGTALQVLRMNSGATAPEWATLSTAGLLHAAGMVSSTTLQGTTSTTFIDVTAMSLNLTLTKTCKVAAFATGISYNNAGTYRPTFILSIGGTEDSNDQYSQKNTDFTPGNPWSTMFLRSSVSSGTCVVKLRMKIENSADTIYFKSGKIVALAFEE